MKKQNRIFRSLLTGPASNYSFCNLKPRQGVPFMPIRTSDLLGRMLNSKRVSYGFSHFCTPLVGAKVNDRAFSRTILSATSLREAKNFGSKQNNAKGANLKNPLYMLDLIQNVLLNLHTSTVQKAGLKNSLLPPTGFVDSVSLRKSQKKYSLLQTIIVGSGPQYIFNQALDESATFTTMHFSGANRYAGSLGNGNSLNSLGLHAKSNSLEARQANQYQLANSFLRTYGAKGIANRTNYGGPSQNTNNSPNQKTFLAYWLLPLIGLFTLADNSFSWTYGPNSQNQVGSISSTATALGSPRSSAKTIQSLLREQESYQKQLFWPAQQSLLTHNNQFGASSNSNKLIGYSNLTQSKFASSGTTLFSNMVNSEHKLAIPLGPTLFSAEHKTENQEIAQKTNKLLATPQVSNLQTSLRYPISKPNPSSSIFALKTSSRLWYGTTYNKKAQVGIEGLILNFGRGAFKPNNLSRVSALPNPPKLDFSSENLFPHKAHKPNRRLGSLNTKTLLHEPLNKIAQSSVSYQTPVMNYKEVQLFLESLIQQLNWNNLRINGFTKNPFVSDSLATKGLTRQLSGVGSWSEGALPGLSRQGGSQYGNILKLCQSYLDPISTNIGGESFIKSTKKPTAGAAGVLCPELATTASKNTDQKMAYQEPMFRNLNCGLKMSLNSSYNLFVLNNISTEKPLFEQGLSGFDRPDRGLSSTNSTLSVNFGNTSTALPTTLNSTWFLPSAFGVGSPILTATNCSLKASVQSTEPSRRNNTAAAKDPFFRTNYPIIQSTLEGNAKKIGFDLLSVQKEETNQSRMLPLSLNKRHRSAEQNSLENIYYDLTLYIKSIRKTLNKYIKFNNSNTLHILVNYLPKNASGQRVYDIQNSSIGQPEPNNSKAVLPPTLCVGGKKNLSVETSKRLSKKPGLASIFEPNMPIVLQHKKFLTLPAQTNLMLRKPTKKADPTVVGQTAQEAEGIHSAISAAPQESVANILHKKDMQKKRKAKKQRLETRRRKKRKRLYPRPIWLRLRLGVSFYKAKTQNNKYKNQWNSNQQKFRILQVPNAKAIMLRKPNSKVDQKKAYVKNLLNVGLHYSAPHYHGRNLLNNYINTLSENTIGILPHTRSVSGKNNKLRRNKLAGLGLFTEANQLYKKAANVTIYNNITYNLWLSTKKTSIFKPSNSSNDNTVKASVSRNEARTAKVSGSSDTTGLDQLSGSWKSNISNYSYENRLIQSKKILTSLKNKASYASFEDKTTQPQKEVDKNTLRDFWIWLYNLTSTNELNKQIYINNILKNLSISVVSLNQASLPSKAQNIGFDLALPMESRNSFRQDEAFDKFGDNQFTGSNLIKSYKTLSTNYNPPLQNRINWALNKTNLWSSTNQRINFWSTQKLRNQSKSNQTKFLEKQLKKQLNNLLGSNLQFQNWLNNLTYLSQNSNNQQKPLVENFRNSKLQISQKIHQKEIKLAYITTARAKSTQKAEPWNNNRVFSTSYYNKSDSNVSLSKLFSLNSRALRSNLFDSSYAHATGMSVGSDGFITKHSPSTLSWFAGQSKEYFVAQSGSGLLMGNASINNASLVNSTKYLPSFGELNTHKVGGEASSIAIFALLLHFTALISLISISQIRCFIKFHLILLYKLSNIYLQTIYKNQELISNIAKQIFNLSSVADARPSMGRADSFKPGRKSLTQYSDSTVGLPYKILIKATSLNSNPKYSRRSMFNSNIVSLRDFMLRKPKATKRAEAFLKPTSTGLAFLDKSSTLFNMANYLFKLSSFVIQLMQFSLAKKVQQTINNADGSYAKATSSRNQEKKKTGVNAINVTLQQNILEKNIKTFKSTTAGSIKKLTYDTSLQVVDTFEYFLRIVYGFFEKPAELTMDWIAYAFLVEWSSDRLTYTPENKDKQNWIAFTKIARQKQSLFAMITTLTYPSSVSKYSNQTVLGFVPGQIASNTLTLASSLILSQFIYKRILYLNDMFLEVLNKPDTDLISRQKKGTLFWDIWSDVLIKAADQYKINVPSLSNIKEEQNLLIDRFLSESSATIGTPDTKSKGGKKNATKGSVLPEQKFSFITIAKLKQKLLFQKPYYLPHTRSVFGKSNSVTDGWQEDSYLYSQFQQKELSAQQNNLYGQPMGEAEGGFWGGQVLSNSTGSLESELGKQKQPLTEYITYQSKETDLFLDYHPPKSFMHLSSIQYYSLVQQPIGTLVCQIYAGILTKQISKNILVIGSTLSSKTYTTFERMQKTLLIQALAGETEIQIITDNAHRYAIVNRGFAVGIKLLKDVFEALSLNTPCLFLLEDIHLIGERRPLLISDHGDSVGDETSKATEVAFGAQRNGDSVHEKNQILYQLNRHGITHYQKPFKGDFSLSIPTNHFSFDLFFQSRYSNFASTPTNPLAYSVNFTNAEAQSNSSQKDFANAIVQKLTSSRTLSGLQTSQSSSGGNTQYKISSSLQITKNKLLSPPSTSPFTILLLKEQKKFKPKKVVKELPWIGLPSEQLSLLPRASYSVRAKVAALADLSFSNMSAKFDMITDLLVIIDSVRGNRGFVVFATTHLPHILDPALRRPGRLDETISIPTLSNIWNRWEFTKAPSRMPIFVHSWTNFLANLAGPTSFLVLGQKNTTREPASVAEGGQKNSLLGSHPSWMGSFMGTLDYLDFLNLDIIPNQKTNILSPIVSTFKKQLLNQNSKVVPVMRSNSLSTAAQTTPTAYVVKQNAKGNSLSLSLSHNINVVQSKKTINIAYYQMGRKILRNIITNSNSSISAINTAFGHKALSSANKDTSNKGIGNTKKNLSGIRLGHNILNFSPIYNNSTTYDSNTLLTETPEYLASDIKYKSIYASTNVIKHMLIGLISGKFSELFAFKTLPIMSQKTRSTACTDSRFDLSLLKTYNSAGFENGLATFIALTNSGSSLSSTSLNRSATIANKHLSVASNKQLLHSFYGSGLNTTLLYGIDQTWRASMSLALSLIQKRYLYNKNLIVPKLVNFLNYAALEEAPSPPASNILIPAKRYENYKKVLNDNIVARGARDFSFENRRYSTKGQSFMKSLYSKAANLSNTLTPDNTTSTAHKAALTLSLHDDSRKPAMVLSQSKTERLETIPNQLLRQATNVNWHYQKNLFKRHKNYLTNQWWNGQLIEHNAETLFLSDIDWRYTFYSPAASLPQQENTLSNTVWQNQEEFSGLKGPQSLALGSDLTAEREKYPLSVLKKAFFAKLNSNKVESSLQTNLVKDILLDFPDSDQHYNPKNRRWVLNSGYWSSWFDVDRKLQADILQNFILDCFIQSYNILDRNRELLDYSVSKYIQKGLFKEMSFVNILQKFD